MAHETLRERFEDDARLAVRLVGIAYVALWLVTWWALGHGSAVLGPDRGCRLESLADVFMWSCTTGTRLHVVADLVNGALASTVWAPAVVMSAAMQPEVRLAAFAVVGLHLVGLPAALLVVIRFGTRLCDRIARRGSAVSGPDTPPDDGAPASGGATLAGATTLTGCVQPLRRKARPPVTPRSTFGLRQAIPS
ncbi:hypothetical protein [Rhodoplanes roseus]|uniref:Uncharacterized protein n=1 Tax=Rhodoplanes roseus TaxID=29409 RepID=A0A327KK09_9BRAD|nr:hypothetical protein [Rhodoplanes roseus]RAI39140.1 hypothetical protein CH341_26480 [Rhodoplanes roseus]